MAIKRDKAWSDPHKQAGEGGKKSSLGFWIIEQQLPVFYTCREGGRLIWLQEPAAESSPHLRILFFSFQILAVFLSSVGSTNSECYCTSCVHCGLRLSFFNKAGKIVLKVFPFKNASASLHAYLKGQLLYLTCSDTSLTKKLPAQLFLFKWKETCIKYFVIYN